MESWIAAAVTALIVWLLIMNSNASAKRLRDALAAYQSSLARLKETPNDADLKQRTLALGRTYANLTRNRKGVTIFDEVALANDIDAACAGAGRQNVPPRGPSVEERLKKLDELKTKRLVTGDEYQAQRRRILAEM